MTPMQAQKISPLSLDPEKLPAEGLALGWTEEGGYRRVAGASTDGKAGVQLLLLDLSRLGERLDEALAKRRAQHKGSKIVVFADRRDAKRMLDCFEAGVEGCVLKGLSADRIGHYLDLVRLGERVFPFALAAHLNRASTPLAQSAAASIWEARLSKRETQILRHIAVGDSNKLIAQQLGVCEATVKVHVKSIHRKLQVENRTQAALWAVTHGLPHLGELGEAAGSLPQGPANSATAPAAVSRALEDSAD